MINVWLLLVQPLGLYWSLEWGSPVPCSSSLWFTAWLYSETYRTDEKKLSTGLGYPFQSYSLWMDWSCACLTASLFIFLHLIAIKPQIAVKRNGILGSPILLIEVIPGISHLLLNLWISDNCQLWESPLGYAMLLQWNFIVINGHDDRIGSVGCWWCPLWSMVFHYKMLLRTEPYCEPWFSNQVIHSSVATEIVHFQVEESDIETM